MPDLERAELVASLDCVDLVLIFDDETPDRVIRNGRLKAALGWIKHRQGGF